MARCLISFGANLGDARRTVSLAGDLLRDTLPAGDQMQMSRHFQTPSVGGPAGQPPFINAVAALVTRLGPWEVWHLIRSIEHQLGRQRIRRWEARKIDLDVLLYEDVRIWTSQLKIPHPRMCMRRFILLPAMDVAADWRDPVSQWTIQQLASQVSSGKGTLLLIAGQDFQPDSLLKDVAQASHSRLLPSEQIPPGTRWDDDQRAVGFLQTDEFFSNWSSESTDSPEDKAQLGPAKLKFFLQSSDPSIPWEDQYRELAIRLRLCERRAASSHPPAGERPRNPSPVVLSSGSTQSIEKLADDRCDETAWNGPRYLLGTHDRAWAVHEIVSALDAMDCPVEPLTG